MDFLEFSRVLGLGFYLGFLGFDLGFNLRFCECKPRFSRVLVSSFLSF